MANGNNSFLHNCFVVVDLNLCGEETGAEEDEILFFYPMGVPYHMKSHFYGWCAAMLNFAKSFAQQPLEVAILDKFKVAFKQVDTIAMILTGTCEQPESTLVKHLDLLYSAFRFYNRSFKAVEERYSSRKEYHQKMIEIGRELVPLLTHNFHKNILRTFNPIPYTPIAHKSNRHFIQANQLLHFVETEPGNLSGCVLYKNSVICTHLDFTTTRFVLNRLDYNKSALYSSSQPQYSSSGRGRMEPVCDFIPVYMLHDDVAELIKSRNNMFPFVVIPTPNAPTSSSLFTSHPFLHQSVDEEEDQNDGFVSLGLCIVSVHELSIAILMTFKAFSNKQHIKKSIWKIPADPHFQALENDLEADTNSITRLPSNTSPTSPVSTATPSHSSPPDPLSSPSPARSSLQPPLLFNARVVQSNSYHFLSYDSLTESGTVTPLSGVQELDFAQASSNLQHTFISDHAISEIIRKDSTGSLYGKHVFGRSVFYQLKHGQTISHDKFLELVAKTVRMSIKDDHNINLI